MERTRMRRGSALGAVLLLVGLGLAGCATAPATSEQPAASEGGADGGTGSGAEPPAESTAPPTETTGEPLPEDWPEEFLVPAGEVTLVQPIGGSVSVLVEGVDSDQAKGLIDQMVAAGMTTTSGVTDMGNDEWVAEVVGPDYSASYSYASGGAGLPNVTIMLSPKA